MTRIPIPPKAAAILKDLVDQGNQIGARIDVALATLRATLDVPDNYVLIDLNEGFVPSPQGDTSGEAKADVGEP